MSQFLKYPTTIHWGFEAVVLGEDRYGHWLGLPRGWRRWKGDVDRSPIEENAVKCLPHDDWWVLHFNGATTGHSHYVDISTPPVRSPGRFEMIDLDLDVLRAQSGEVEIDDEDEFEIHQVTLGYPAEYIQMARTTTDRVALMVDRLDEPFGQIAIDWLEKFEEMELPSSHH